MIMRRRAAVRTVGRLAVGTAVVAGTAGAVRHHQDQKYAAQDAQQQAQYDDSQQQVQMEQLEQQNAAQQQQIQQMQAQQAAAQQAAPAPAAPAAGGTDMNSQLMQLSQMHNAGVLTDEEFAQAKAKLLAGG